VREWSDVVMAAHGRGVSITTVLAEIAREDAAEGLDALVGLFGREIEETAIPRPLEEIDWEAVAAAAERMLNAATAAYVMDAGDGWPGGSFVAHTGPHVATKA
jgi:hypothetical protein